MAWHPLISLLAGFLGSIVERGLGNSGTVVAWLVRILLPLASGVAWTVLVGSVALDEATSDYQVRRLLVDLGIYTAFSTTAWVGIYAARRAREEHGD